MKNKKVGYDQSIREFLNALDKSDWEDTLARVLKYSRSKTKFLFFLNYKLDPEELAQEAISLAYGVGSGKFGKITYRNWNREKYPLLSGFLISTINSLVDHILKEVKGFSFHAFENDTGEENYSLEMEINDKHNPSPTPENLLIEHKKLTDLGNFLEKISNNDQEIGMLLLAIEEGYITTRDQSTALGLDRKDVNNIKRRLRRRVNSFSSS